MTTTIMVADDSKSSRKVNVAMVRELLGDKVNCIEATGGEDALAQLAGRPVDLVLLDLTMPGVSGYDVLAELKRRHSKVRVIVISADIQRMAKERVAALGATGFIDKPVHIEALRTILTQLGVLHG